MANNKSKGGRKPKHDYDDPMFILQIEGWARDGYDDKQIAELLDLDPTWFCKVKNQYPQLTQALKKGRQPLEVLVENSLFKRATGMKVKSIIRKWDVYEDDEGNIRNVQIVQETETELPPDTGAAMAWLKHKKPEVWNIASKMQMEQDIHMSGSIEIDAWLDANSDEEETDSEFEDE